MKLECLQTIVYRELTIINWDEDTQTAQVALEWPRVNAVDPTSYVTEGGKKDVWNHVGYEPAHFRFEDGCYESHPIHHGNIKSVTFPNVVVTTLIDANGEEYPLKEGKGIESLFHLVGVDPLISYLEPDWEAPLAAGDRLNVGVPVIDNSDGIERFTFVSDGAKQPRAFHMALPNIYGLKNVVFVVGVASKSMDSKDFMKYWEKSVMGSFIEGDKWQMRNPRHPERVMKIYGHTVPVLGIVDNPELMECLNDMAQNDLERHENRLFCFCECPSAREMIFVNLVDLIMPLLLMGLLFGRPVKNGLLAHGSSQHSKSRFPCRSKSFCAICLCLMSTLKP